MKVGGHVSNSESHIRGLIFVCLGAILWGVGGTATDYIFKNTPVTVDWYVTTRLIISGVILLLIYLIFFRKKHSMVWDKYIITMFIIYSIFGMTAVQYTYTAAIGHGNAAIATVLQCTGPIYIILYYVFKKYIQWTYREAIVIIVMIIGVALIATNGDFTVFAVPPKAIFWGLLSGVALAYYTIHAGYLLVRLHPLQLVGGSMLVGGVLLNFFAPIWSFDFSYEWQGFDLAILAFSIFFGTTLAFYLYIGSLKYISSKEAGILGLLEPVSAIITSVLVLGVVLGFYQFVGIIMVLLVTIFNTLSSGKRGKEKLN